MFLATSHDLTAKLTAEVRETHFEHRLENLKSTLQTGYKIVRENNRKSHDTNKLYYDQKAKERQFRPGKIIYLFNPARKPGQFKIFHCLARTLQGHSSTFQVQLSCFEPTRERICGTPKSHEDSV
jgi:hypothetical protein